MTKRISGRVALLIISVAGLAVLVLGWMMFVGPERSKAADLSTKVASTETQVSDAQRLLAGSTGKKSLAALHQLQVAMPDQEKISGILRQLQSIANTTQVELDTVTPLAPTVVGVAGEESVPMTVIVTGHYFGIQRFLRLLRASADLHNGRLVSNGRLFTVDSIQFTGAPKGGVINATMAVNGFIYSAAAASAATTVTPPTTSNTSATAVGP
jgi:Tfp pilus assembly protein PilO